MIATVASPHRTTSLRRTIAKLTPASLAVQVCSFISSIVLARVLGASASTDAYYLGLSVPVAAYAILIAAIRLGAIPALTASDQSREPHALDRPASDLVSAVLVASVLLTILVTAAAELVVPAAVGGRTGSMSRLVMLELAPLGVLGAVTGLLGAALAVRHVFAPTVAVMSIEPLLKTVLTLTLGHTIGINALIVGNVAGSAIAAAILWWRAARAGVALRLRTSFDTPFVRGVLGLSIPLVVSQSVLQANPIVDRTMAGSLGAGSVTALELGLRLCFVPTAFLTGILISPVTATWAQRKLSGGWSELRQSLAGAIVAIATFVLPLVALGVILRHEVVSLVYEGGSYSPLALAQTTKVFALILLVVPAQILVVVLSTLFVIERDTIFPMLIGIANVTLNVVLNFALRPFLGVAGIALSTTLTLSILGGVYAAVAHRRWRALSLSGSGNALAVAAGATLAIVGMSIALLDALPEATSRLRALVAIVVVGGAGLGLQALVLFARRRSRSARLHIRSGELGV